MKKNIKHTQKNGFASFALIALIVIAGIVSAGYFVIRNRTSSDSQNESQINTTQDISDGSKLTVNNSLDITQAQTATILGEQILPHLFYTIELKDDSIYYGQIQKINESHFRLSPVYYAQGSTITVLGNELHGPENAMYVRVDSVSGLRQLGPSEVLSAIEVHYSENTPVVIEDAYPSQNIEDYVKSDAYQALFMNDGTVYFARILQFDPLTLKAQAYNLRADTTENTTSPNISLQKTEASLVEELQDSNVLFWENLKPEGQVSTAISQYESQ